MNIEFSGNLDQAVKAAERFENLVGKRYCPERMALIMDLTAADGVNGNPPLDWSGLLAAPDGTFAHDVGGITRHIDRKTGKLGNCFLPRTAIV